MPEFVTEQPASELASPPSSLKEVAKEIALAHCLLVLGATVAMGLVAAAGENEHPRGDSRNGDKGDDHKIEDISKEIVPPKELPKPKQN